MKYTHIIAASLLWNFSLPSSSIGVPAFLVVAVTGLSTNDEATFSHVTLLKSNGESFQKVLLNSSTSNWSGKELIGFIESVPRKPFSVCLCGKDRRGNELERASTEMVQPTHVHIMVRLHIVHNFSLKSLFKTHNQVHNFENVYEVIWNIDINIEIKENIR